MVLWTVIISFIDSMFTVKNCLGLEMNSSCKKKYYTCLGRLEEWM